jgi:hypothetical protein
MLIRIRSRAALVALLLLCVLSASCKDKNLRDLVNAADKVADTVAIVQQAVVDGENAGTITRNQARAIMSVTIQISKGNNDAMDVARDLAKLDEPSRQQLLTILTPIIAAVNRAVGDQNILGIQNAQTREAIRGSFVAIQTSLNSINLILAASK